jgi:hypothetical protein
MFAIHFTCTNLIISKHCLPVDLILCVDHKEGLQEWPASCSIWVRRWHPLKPSIRAAKPQQLCCCPPE